MKLVIGVLLYRQHSFPYLSKFLPSLEQASAFLSAADNRILIGDNSGQDEANRQFFTKQANWVNKKLEFFDFKANLGFAKAYNLLINRAIDLGADYFLMINPDVLIDPLAIEKLLTVMEKNLSLASVSPKILHWDFENNKLSNFIDSGGIILRPGLIFKDLGQGVKDFGQFDQVKILGPSGAVALFRLTALIEVAENGQYFDEQFFMYKEDCDLIYRLSLKNWSSQLVPDSIFYHDRSVRGGTWWAKLKTRKKRSRQERTWSWRGQHHLFFKHWSKQTFFNKIMIALNIFKIFIFSLIFEQFLLKEYFNRFRS